MLHMITLGFGCGLAAGRENSGGCGSGGFQEIPARNALANFFDDIGATHDDFSRLN